MDGNHEKKRITLRMTQDDGKQFKVMAARAGMTQTELVLSWMREKQGKESA